MDFNLLMLKTLEFELQLMSIILKNHVKKKCHVKN